jgi:hypothetical protein
MRRHGTQHIVCTLDYSSVGISLGALCELKLPPNTPSVVGFEVFTAVVLKSIIFWDMTPCSP